MSEPEWTRVRPSLNQKSVIDYVIGDNQLMRESGVVQVDRTDIRASDHYLVWLELGRTTKHSRKGKRVIRKWRLDRLGDGVKLNYIMALQAEVSRFSESIQSKVASGMVGSTLYKCFGREVQFKKYLHGLSDAGTRLLFKFRSGTHGLNEELGRHRGREGKKECVLCGDECESVSHT